MAALIRPNATTRPVLGAPIYWGRRETVGLNFCAAFNEPAGALINSVNGQRGAPSSGVTRTYGKEGQGASFAAATDRFNFGPSNLNTLSENFSVVFRGRWLTGTYRTAGTNDGFYGYYAWGSTATNALFTLRNVADIDSGLALTSGRYYSIGIGYKRGVSARFYVLDLSTMVCRMATIADANAPATGAAFDAYIGARNAAGTPDFGWTDQLSFTAYWNRLLRDDELRNLVYNPWLLFAPSATDLGYFLTPPAAGGGSTVNLLRGKTAGLLHGKLG